MERKIIITIYYFFILLVIVSCTIPVTIHRAAMNGNVESIQERLQIGDNVNAYDRLGWTPLMWAVYYNQLNAVKYLLSQNANPNCTSVDSYGTFRKGTTPLMLCANYDYRVIAKILITSGANPNQKDEFGNTAITYAELNNYLEMLVLLQNSSGN